MSLNWREIDLILSELPLQDARIQKIRQPNFLELVLETYAPGKRLKLLISLEAGRTRLHALSARVESEVKLQRFAQLLRSRVLGGLITEIGQIGEERIVRIVIDRAEEKTNLYIRLWSGAANIILTDEDNVILDAFYRRPKRNEVSGAQFETPDANSIADRPKREFAIRDIASLLESPLADTDTDTDVPIFNRQIEAYYRQEITSTLSSSLQERASRELERERDRLAARLDKITRRIETAENGDAYKRYGDLISSNLYRIRPGDTRLVVEDYYNEGKEIEIEIDPHLSGGDNADTYYRKYKDFRKELERLVVERDTVGEELADVESRIDALEDTEDPETLRKLGGLDTGKKQTKPKADAIPGLQFRSGDHVIYVGRSSRENDALLRHHVRGNDMWMHTRDVPGGYVFIRDVPGKSIPLEVLLDAGTLAVYFSKAKSNGKADLFYTRVKYLRRAKTGSNALASSTRALVIPTQEKNLTVEIEEPRLARLFS